MKKKMHEQEFNTIKLMLKGGATIEQVNEFRQISRETLRRIRKAESFAEYRQVQDKYRTAAAQKKEEPKPAEPESPTLSVNYQMNRVYGLLERQNELLQTLTDKVTFLVDSLTK